MSVQPGWFTYVESVAVSAWRALFLATPNRPVLDSRYPRERDWPDVRVVTFRRMIYSDYWYEKRLKSTLYTYFRRPLHPCHVTCTYKV